MEFFINMNNAMKYKYCITILLFIIIFIIIFFMEMNYNEKYTDVNFCPPMNFSPHCKPVSKAVDCIYRHLKLR